jgi:putative Holliday junction resolvase
VAVVLALDPGERRTGLAICDPAGILASPLETHDRKRDRSLLERVATLCAERGVERVLVGFPLTAAGECGASARRSEILADKLRARLELPVELVDERYSTAEAQKILAGTAHSRADRDALAAALVLQAWLDARSLGGDPS